MSRRDDRVSLVDMLIHAKEAVALSGETSLNDLIEDRVMQLALQKIGRDCGRSGQPRFRRDTAATRGDSLVSDYRPA